MRISRAGAPSGGDGVWVAVPTSLEGLWGKPEPRSALRGQGPAVRLCWGNQAPTAEQSLHTGPQNPSTGERQEADGSPAAGLGAGVFSGIPAFIEHLLCALQVWSPRTPIKEEIIPEAPTSGGLAMGEEMGHSAQPGEGNLQARNRCGQWVAMTKRKHQRVGFWPNQPPQSRAEGGVASGEEPIRYTR